MHPSVDQFKTDLTTVYYVANKPPLQKEFLEHLVSSLAGHYQLHVDGTPDEAYDLFLEASLKGLTAFTQRIDPRCLEQPAEHTLFKTWHLIDEFLGASGKNGFVPSAATHSAYSGLAEPFRDVRAYFRSHGKFHCIYPDDYLHEPVKDYVFYPIVSNYGYDEKESRRAVKEAQRKYEKAKREAERKYEREKKEYEKRYKELWDAVDDFQSVFLGTPLFDWHPLTIFPCYQLQRPFPIPPSTRFLGTWIIGNPNKGKTNLLRYLVLSDIQESGASVIIIDSKGNLIDTFKKLDTLKDRLVILDPTNGALAINPLHIGKGIHAIELMEYLFGALVESGQLTGLQSTLFRQLLFLLQAVPNSTIHTLREILVKGIGPYAPYAEGLRDDRRTFFLDGTKQNPAPFDSPTYKETRNQLMWRIDNVLSNQFMYDMLATKTTKIKLGQLMDAGKVIIIDNNERKLGASGAEFLGRFFIALIRAAALERTERKASQKKPCYVYLDECHNVIQRDPKINEILDECRDQKIAMIMAHQRMGQVEDTVLDGLVNCGIKFINVDQDAPHLAARLKTEKSLNLPIGTFAAQVRGNGQDVQSLQVPEIAINDDYTLAGWPVMTRAAYGQLLTEMRVKYTSEPLATPPATAPAPTPPPKTESRH